MKLVRVRHIRCDEHSGTNTWAFAPDDWSLKEINDAVDRARNNYLDAILRALQVLNASEPTNPGFSLNEYINKTKPDESISIGQVRKEYEEAKAKYTAWKEERNRTRDKFETYLEKEGFISIWSDEAGAHITNVEVDWGHRHGVRLVYGDPELDTFPSPMKLAGVDDGDGFGI